jgi:tRNA pseudouridine55 synthase
MSFPFNGFLLLDKKPGLTSFETLAAVKRAFSTVKVGHTGTLDKFASGLMLILVGRGVKLAPLFLDCTKEYEGTIRFGTETDTLDPEGTVIAEGKVPSRAEIETALEAFRGNIMQAPPQYSAVHINGRRAHELAREGKAVEMKERPVTVHSLELVSWTPPEAVLRAHVSSGTYIRSLARDIALAAGSRGYLTALKRTMAGPFSLENAEEGSPSGSPDGVATEVAAEEKIKNALRPLDADLFKALSIPSLVIDEKAELAFKHGASLDKIFPGAELDSIKTQFAGVFSKNEPIRLLGILENKNNQWSYGHVFADN